MSAAPPRLAILWLGDGAGPAAPDVLHPLGACLGDGDALVPVSGRGCDRTARGIGRYLAETGHLGMPHVRAAGAAGWEEGADLALSALESVSDPPELVLFAGPHVRLDRAALDAARARMGPEGHDLLRLSWADAEGPAAGDLFSLLVRRDLLGGLRPAADGLPQLLWRIARDARSPADHDEPLGTRGPDLPLLPRLAADLARLLEAAPEAAPWVRPLIPGWQARTGPAGRAAWAAARDGLERHLQGALAPVHAPLPAPPVTGRGPIKLWRAGAHARRTPFAYPALADLWAGRAVLLDAPEGADLVVFAHPADPMGQGPETARAIEAGARAALISEEPFWDSLFSPDLTAPHVTLPAAHLGEVWMAQVNHHASPIFDWAHLPYYLFTDPAMIPRLAAAFAAPLPERPPETRVTFMAERRPEGFHDIARAEADLLGLCAWRTRLAESVANGPVRRLGASWEGGATRFELGDWHADKLARLTGTTAILSGVENTHQPTYLSEKLFDAFACGAGALYVASPGHSAHRLGLPEGSWLNLYGMTSEGAAAVDGWTPDRGAIAAARATLAARFSDAPALAAERARIGTALAAELDRLMG